MQRYGSPRRWTATFEGNALTMTNPLRRRAADLYAHVVREMNLGSAA